jgi:hypothetical protein
LLVFKFQQQHWSVRFEMIPDASLRASVFRKVKAVKRLRGGVPGRYVAQASVQANAEIAEKWRPT